MLFRRTVQSYKRAFWRLIVRLRHTAFWCTMRYPSAQWRSCKRRERLTSTCKIVPDYDMTTAISPLILIPARMSSTRLPGKPLADIHGEPMIVHVMRRANEAALGRVVVATDSADVAEVIERAGGEVVMTRSDHPSGSDRIHEAAHIIDELGKHQIAVSLQGDLPTVSPKIVRAVEKILEEDPSVDVATAAVEITADEERIDPHVVKVVGSPLRPDRLRALYFTRATAPYGDGPLYHHIGLYAYRRAVLDRFVSLPPSTLEKRESLEQLRALEAGMRIDVAIVDDVPIGVDTPADLERARALMAPR